MHSVTRARWTVAVAAPLALAVGLGLAVNAAGRARRDRPRLRRPGSAPCTSASSTTTARPVADLSPADFVVREDGVAARCCAAERPPTRCRLRCWSTTSQAARATIADMRRALHRVRQADGRQEHDRHHRVRRSADDRSPTTRSTSPSLLKGVDRMFPRPAAGRTCSQAVRRNRARARQARRRTRAVIVAVTAGGPSSATRNYHGVHPDRCATRGAALDVDRRSTVGPPTCATDAQPRACSSTRARRASGGRRGSRC